MIKRLDFSVVPTRQFLRVRKNKRHYTIAVFSADHQLIEQIVNGFHFALHENQENNHYSLELFSGHFSASRPAFEDKLSYIKGVLAEKHYDAILSIGVISTQILKALSEGGCKTPVVFCMTSTPEQHGFVDSLQHAGSNLVGVETDFIREDIYAQALMKLKPDVRHILLPYNRGKGERPIDEILENTCSDLEKTGSKITLLDVTYEPDGLAAIEKATQGGDYDVMFFLHRPRLAIDFVACGKLCREKNILLICDVVDCVGANAAFSVVFDFSVIGHEAGLVVRSILEDGNETETMPVRKIRCPRRVELNEKLLAEHAITVTPQLVESIESELLVYYQDIHYVPVFSPAESNMFSDVITGMCDWIERKTTAQSSYFYPYFCEVDVAEKSIAELVEQMRYLVVSPQHDMPARIIVAFGKKMTRVAHEVVVQSGRKIPVLSVISQDEEPAFYQKIHDAKTSKTRLTGDVATAYVAVAAAPVAIPLECLDEIHPEVENILILYSGDDEAYERLKRSVEKECSRVCFSFVWERVEPSDDIASVVGRHKRKIDAVVFFEAYMHMRLAHAVSRVLRRMGIPLVAGGLESAPYGAALSVGANIDRIGGEIYAYMDRIITDYQDPTFLPPVLIPDTSDIRINLEAARDQGVVLSRAQALLYKDKIMKKP